MLEDVETTLRAEMDDAGSEDAFWFGVAASGTPRIDEDGQHTHVTLLWREPTEFSPFRVYVDASSLTDHHASELTTMTRLADTRIWFWSTEVSRTWRGSYRFMPVSREVVDSLDPPGIGDTLGGIRSRFLGLLAHAVPDVSNPHRFGDSSVASMPDAPLQRWWDGPEAAEPRKARWDSPILGNERDVWIHESGSSDAKAERPLVVILDGAQWVRDSPLAPVLDNATAAGVLPPAVYLFVDSIESSVRGRELPCNPEFWRAIVDELIPLAAKDFAFTSNPRRTVAAGQSYGGLASLYAALEFPERFGLVSSQSGSFWWPIMSHGDVRGPAGGRTAELLEAVSVPLKTVVDMTVGIHEGDMIRHNSRVRDKLQGKGVRVFYSEFDGGHEWLCWRSELLESLVRLLEQSEDSPDETGGDDQYDDTDQREKYDR